MKKFFAVTLSILLTIYAMPTYAAELSATADLLYVVDTLEYKNNIVTSELTSSWAQMAEIVTLEECDFSQFEYDFFAAPVSLANQIPLNSLFHSGVCVYLYGNLTIGDFKDHLQIEDFYVKKNVFDQNNNYLKTVYQEFQDTSTYQVIGLSHMWDKGMLCKIDSNPVIPYEYFYSIVSNLTKPVTYASSLIESNFDFVSFYDDSYASTHLDYLLYKDTSEADSQHDYYAVTTNVWGECSRGIIRSVSARHTLYNAADNIYNHQPSEQSTSEYTVGLSIPSGQISVSGSFTKKLNIAVTANYTTDLVEWTASRATPYIGTGDISSEVLVSGSSWATAKEGAYPTVTLEYKGVRSTNNGTGINDVKQSWQTVTVGYTEL